MDPATFITLAASGLVVAFIHAAIPTHWLPFVVVARAQGWSRGRALLMVTLCSGGHVLMTTALVYGSTLALSALVTLALETAATRR